LACRDKASISIIIWQIKTRSFRVAYARLCLKTRHVSIFLFASQIYQPLPKQFIDSVFDLIWRCSSPKIRLLWDNVTMVTLYQIKVSNLTQNLIICLMIKHQTPNTI